MAMADSANYEDPLDFLHRFIPTPLRTSFRVSTATVMVETNDFNLLPPLPLETESVETKMPTFEWKLIRDSDARGQLEEPLYLMSGKLTVVSMGAACLLGLDRERGELLCFIGAEIDAGTFQAFLVPLFCQLTNEIASKDCLEYSDEWNEGKVDA